MSSAPPGGPGGWLGAWARERPDAVAVAVSGGRSLRWAALCDEVHTRADTLVRSGVTPGSVVAIVMSDPLEQRLYRWAANVAGAVDALLDPRLPPGEVERRLARAAARVVVTAEGVGLRASAPVTSGPGRVLYTSGSTGDARAVLAGIDQLDAAAAANAAVRRLDGTIHLLALLPAFHAAGSLFEDTTMRLGGTILLPGVAGPGDDRLWRRPGAVTTVVPSLLASLGEAKGGLGFARGMRLVNYAGEAMPIPLLRALLTDCPGRVTRGYGLTQAGPLVSVLGDEAHRRAIPDPAELGEPAPGVEVRVSTDGTLEVRSDHVMLGYVGDPEATRADLTVDGWLRTDDMVRIEAGRLTLLGRVGARIRTGGEWVHPGEVERVLASVPGMVEVCVVAARSARWGECPVAYVVVDADLDRRVVGRTLGVHLARFQWPAWIEPLPCLPRTGSGKVDRAELAQRAGRGPGGGAWRPTGRA